MSYTAPNRLLMPMRHSIDTRNDSWLPDIDFPGSSVWPSANLAIYVPLRIPSRVVVQALWFSSNTTGTGNVDMGLYDATGAAVISATAAAKTASASEQVFNVTDTTVGPGLYYIALASNSGTDTFYRWTLTAPLALAYGVLYETSAYPLPATATWTTSQTQTLCPFMGLFITGIVT